MPWAIFSSHARRRGAGGAFASPVAALVLVLALVAGLGCGPAEWGGAGSGEAGSGNTAAPPNLILVVIDTLRADHLGVYGYGRPTSPALDRLAAESALFTQARAQAPCTFPSVNSLLTSRHPWAFSGRPQGHLGIPPEVPTLASRLRRAGYRTVAVSASPVVRDSPSQLNREGGFGAGFDLFLEGCRWQQGGCVQRQARRVLSLVAEPFFLYLHYLDPHDPYRAPDGARRFTGAPPAGAGEDVAAGDPLPAARRLYGTGDAGLTAGELAHLRDRYDEEVASVDRQLGHLHRLLAERGLLETTLLVVTADHGESFLEHGHLRHCRSLHEEELRVPLLVRPPGGPGAGSRVEEPAALLDVAPTLLDYAGALDPADGWAGRSLGGWVVEGRGEAAREVPDLTASSGTRRALVAGRYKLIHDLDGGASRLFDLRADPGEERDLAAQRPRVTAELLRRLDRHLRAVEGAGLDGGAGRLDRSRETERQLRALGYLQ